MSVILVSTESSRPFASRLAERLGVPLQSVERRSFPDGERYARFDLADRFELVGKDVVVVGATEEAASLDDLYRDFLAYHWHAIRKKAGIAGDGP
jgi:phosphoribosylpyrophosphate synthetase